MSAAVERGAGLVALLVVLVVLGGVAVLVLQAQSGGDTQRNSVSDGPGVTLSASPGNAASNISAAASVTCRTDYEAAMQAVSYFEALNGRPPSSAADLSTIVKDPLTSPYFTISIDPHHAGVVDVATKSHPPSAGDANCAYAG